MSKLRNTQPGTNPSPTYADSFYMIRDAVLRSKGLIYGTLTDSRGEHCAIGAFWADNPNLSLQNTVIDEVASYNDSIPKTASKKVRRTKVLAWLKWKLRVLAGG